jgi:hypothetical protein
MIENNLRKTIEKFTDIVEAIEDLEIVEREAVSKLKAKLRLFDGSMLWVREVWVKRVSTKFYQTFFGIAAMKSKRIFLSPPHMGLKIIMNYKL